MPDGPVKLGFTINISTRLRKLQTGAHEELKVIWTTFGDMNTERKLHVLFDNFRIRGEWFDFGDMTDDRIGKMLARALTVRMATPITNLPEWLASWPDGQ